ncbi:hypothetical protein H0H87_012805 [Tephrocybe sp. NHM501043]|nr:hypothetical protein H0H87_012805 [Tephrocybe sp. NHM501043]
MLRAIYYNEDGEENDTRIQTMRFASSVIGPMGTTVDPDFDGDDNPDSEQENDAVDGIVFSRDPFSAGMTGGTMRGKGKERQAVRDVGEEESDGVVYIS